MKGSKAPRQGGEVIKDSDHATQGSLLVQGSEDPREAVSSGLAGSPAHMSRSSAPQYYVVVVLGSHSALPGCEDLAEDSTQRATGHGRKS